MSDRLDKYVKEVFEAFWDESIGYSEEDRVEAIRSVIKRAAEEFYKIGYNESSELHRKSMLGFGAKAGEMR